MKIVKFCKDEHNLAKGCNTLQLGTFQYYRDLDPSFSIADEKEGYIHYLGPKDKITIGAEELNSITGGVMTVSDATKSHQKVPFKNPGAAQIEMTGHSFEFREDGTMVATLDGKLEVKLHYPNCYIFCASILDDDQKPDPKKISKDYDSCYEISQKGLNTFIQTITRSLTEQLSLSDVKIEGALAESPLLGFRQQFQIICRHRPVTYVPEKEIRLNTPEDFTRNRFYEIYVDSMFKKHESYSNDREYRFIFFLHHPVFDFLSVHKEPKILKMKPISDQIQTL